MNSGKYWRALDAARHFSSLGLVALPSRMDVKRPMLDSFKQYKSQPVPASVYDPANWRTTNIQVMTGIETAGATKVMVVDLDGPEAVTAWKTICAKQGFSIRGGARQWVCNTGSGGIHIYFSVPSGAVRCPSRMIWGLYDTLTGWVKHREIRILGDGGLAVAPPSVRVDGTGSYSWHRGYCPESIPLPDVAPAWLFNMPGVLAPDRKHYDQPETKHVQSSHDDLRSKVLAAIGQQEKINLARSWGLRFADAYPRIGRGWLNCHAVGREDKTPSAGFDPVTGVYNEFGGSGKACSLFDLAVLLGAYKSWKEASDSLASEYLLSR